MTATTLKITQDTDGVDVEECFSWSYDEEPVRVLDIPRFEFELENESGINAHKFYPGKEVTLRRNNEPVFVGVVETTEPSADARSGNRIRVRGVHKGYHYLRRSYCDSYDFDEDGDPSTTRDGVTVNPWSYFVFREPASTLDVYGNNYPTHGINIRDGIRAMAGTRFVYQHDFQDNTHLLASDVYATTNSIQVFRDGPSADTRPALQRARKDGDGFHDNPAGEKIESIPLMNGDPNIREMGAMGNVDVVLIGERDGTDDPVIELCADAGLLVSNSLTNNASRNYSSVTLSHTANYNGSGLSAWTGSVDLTSATRATNYTESLGYRIRIAGSDGSAATTKIYYIALVATTASDVDLTEGTADAYDNGGELDGLRGGAVGDEQDWLEGDFLGQARIEAVERIREQTESDSTVNTSPHWDFHVDKDLAYHFQERRGSDLTKEYSFDAENLLSVSHEFYGGELAYQTIALGTGGGTAQTRIVSKAEFSAGGLYDSDRDPTTGAATSELANIAQVRRFIDTDESSILALFRKARAFHSFHRVPTEKFDVSISSSFVREFGVGDGLLVKNLQTRTNDTIRAVAIRRSGSGRDREKLRITLGDPSPSFTSMAASTNAKTETLTIRPPQQTGTLGLSGNGIYCDKDFVGVYPLQITNGEEIDRVFLRLATRPWMTTSKVADFSATATASGAIGTFNGTVSTTPVADLDDPGVSGSANASFINGTTAQTNVPTTATTAFSSTTGTTTVTSGSTNNNLDDTTGTVTFSGVDGVVVEWEITSGTANSVWEVEIRLEFNNLAQMSLNIRHADNMDSGEDNGDWTFIPSNLMKSAGGSATSLKAVYVDVKNVGGSNQDYSGFMNTYTVPRHDHDDGTLAGDSTATLNAGTDVDDDDVRFTSSLITNLLSSMEIGYTAASGGTGAIAFSRGGTDYYEEHEHDVDATNVPLEFGPYFFAGDSVPIPTAGVDAPVYGRFNFSIDAADADGDGVPTAGEFSAAQHPTALGKASGPQEIELDVTGWLDTDANGTIENKVHKIYLKGIADSGNDNAGGLVVVDVGHYFKFKEQSA